MSCRAHEHPSPNLFPIAGLSLPGGLLRLLAAGLQRARTCAANGILVLIVVLADELLMIRALSGHEKTGLLHARQGLLQELEAGIAVAMPRWKHVCPALSPASIAELSPYVGLLVLLAAAQELTQAEDGDPAFAVIAIAGSFGSNDVLLAS
ncbi:hypothetical protein LTR37_015503 [Vermiconidia calcicola]|uniref:Uncharacterized protein n=1 Tax=Vermiconidia calcicola TaxID=1690605 RepID=A0ACC3MQG6_9PEZI|nr:hypothetical protein LTR37_015503 [Vermiconidia calcicola]